MSVTTSVTRRVIFTAYITGHSRSQVDHVCDIIFANYVYGNDPLGNDGDITHAPDCLQYWDYAPTAPSTRAQHAVAKSAAPADLEQLREVGRRGCACARANKAHISRVDAREGEGWSCARHCHFAPHAAAVLALEAASQQPRPECARKHKGVRTSSFAGRGTSCRWASTSVSKSRHGGRPARQQSSQALRSSARLCA